MPMEPAKDALDVGIIVSDIAASLTFYRDLLGLAKVQEVPLWFGTMHRLAFGNSFIKLVDPKAPPLAGPPGLDSQLGFRYVTFQVANLDELCDELTAAGVPFEMKKSTFMPGVAIAMVKDPDGNIVEFVQRD